MTHPAVKTVFIYFVYLFICRAGENQRGTRHWGEVEWGGETTEERHQHAMQGDSFN